MKFFLSVVLILALLLLNNVFGLAQSNVCFTSIFDNAHSFNVDSWPHSVASADFNNDGKLDLIVTNTGSATLSLLKGEGGGKFLAAQAIEVGSQPTGVTASDFNNDGKIDIAFADQDVNLVFVLLGNGDGTFLTPTGFFVGSRPLSIVSADFNNDGNVDIATANYYSNDISVALGNGLGTFPDATPMSTGINPYAITTGDFNGDGIIDLSTANSDEQNFMAGNVSVFTGNGFGSFTRVDHSVGWNPIFVTSADLNLDGRSDLIASNSGSQNISVLLAEPLGGFLTPTNYPIVGQPVHITSSDFDGDGFKDVAVIDIQAVNIVLFNGSASGSLTWKDNYAIGGSSNFVISPDLNSDAIPDLVLLKPDTRSVDIWLGKTGSLFDGIKSNQVGFTPGALVTADFNLDGKTDIATPNFDSDNVSVLLANSVGNLNAAINSAAGSNPSSMSASDFNSDGKPDIAVCNYNDDKVSLLMGNGDGSFDAPVSYNVGSRPQKILSADFNGDNKMDIAVFNSYDNNISILYGDGAGDLAGGTIVTNGPSISDFVSADFNKDGKFDLAVLDWSESNVTLMLNDGAGNFIQSPKYQVGLNPSIILAADMDSDDNIDLIVNGHNHNISLLKGTGTGVLSPRLDYTANIPHALAVSDFNNDNKLDIAYNSSGIGLCILLAKPTEGFLPEIIFKDALWLLTSADINNDGLPDIVGTVSNHDVVVLHNNTAVIKALGPTSFCSGNSVVLSATVNGYTYDWNGGGSATNDLTITTGGSYNVTITNQSGSCSSTSNTITVSVPPPAPVVILANPTCNDSDGSITVEIRNASDTYSFDNGLTFQASNVKTNLTHGSYNVIIRESTGCTSLAASVIFEVPIDPTAPHTSYAYFFCPDSPGTITITPQTFGETYSIDQGITFQSSNYFNNLYPGLYEVVIKSRSGCISPTTPVYIYSLTPPLPQVSVTQPTCNTPTGSISLVVNNWSDAYSFDDGITFQSAPEKGSLAPGIYAVRVRTLPGCISDPTFVEIIDPPSVPSQPLVTMTQPSCTSSTGSLSVDVQQPTDSYSFDNGTTFQSSHVISDLTPGLYHIVIRNSAGCLSVASNIVLLDPPIVPMQPAITLAQPTCDVIGSITVIEQTVGELYSFDNGVSFQTDNTKALGAGTYQVVIKSIDGCSSISTLATILDAPVTPSSPLLTLTQPNCDIPVGSISVAVQDSNDSYSFDGGITLQPSPNKSDLLPGNYNVVIYRNNGCSSIVSEATINQQPAKPSKPLITFTSFDPTQHLLISSSGPICKWFKDGMLITDEGSTTFVVTSTGSYSVVAVNSEGCESEASDPVEVNITGIEENSDNVQLYPNPTAGRIFLNLTGFTLGKELNITIVNTSGMIVRQLAIIAAENTSLDLAQLVPNKYILLLEQSEKKSATLFIKK